MKIKRLTRRNVRQALPSDPINEVSAFSNYQTVLGESCWFPFNVGKMNILNTDNLFNLDSQEPDVQDQLIFQFIERVYTNPSFSTSEVMRGQSQSM